MNFTSRAISKSQLPAFIKKEIFIYPDIIMSTFSTLAGRSRNPIKIIIPCPKNYRKMLNELALKEEVI